MEVIKSPGTSPGHILARGGVRACSWVRDGERNRASQGRNGREARCCTHSPVTRSSSPYRTRSVRSALS